MLLSKKRIIIIVIAAVVVIAAASLFIGWKAFGLFAKAPSPTEAGDVSQSSTVENETTLPAQDDPGEEEGTQLATEDSGEEAVTPPATEEPQKQSDVLDGELEGEWYGVYQMSEREFFICIAFEENLKCTFAYGYDGSDTTGSFFGEYYFDQSRGRLTLDIYPAEWIWDGDEKDIYDGYFEDTGRENSTEQIKCEFLVRQASVGSMLITALSDTRLVPINTSSVMYYRGTSSRKHVFFHEWFEYYHPINNPENTSFDIVGLETQSILPEEFLSTFEQLSATRQLNVRLGPGKNYISLGDIPKGTVMDKIGTVSSSDDWIFVLLDSGAGWVKAEYTEPAADKLTLYEAGNIAKEYIDSKNEKDKAQFHYTFASIRKIQEESVYVVNVEEVDEYTEYHLLEYGSYGVGITTGNLYDMASGKRID